MQISTSGWSESLKNVFAQTILSVLCNFKLKSAMQLQLIAQSVL